MDETYIKVHGKWCYLYRAIDRDGNLVDSRLSETRDMAAAKRFFQQAVDVVGHAPEQVTTDGHTSYPRAIRETLGSLEQDHRRIKQRHYPMHGFGTFKTAARFCCAFDELRNYLRPRCAMGELVSLSEQRQAFLQRLVALKEVIRAAS